MKTFSFQYEFKMRNDTIEQCMMDIDAYVLEAANALLFYRARNPKDSVSMKVTKVTEKIR